VKAKDRQMPEYMCICVYIDMQTHTCVYAPAGRESLEEKTRQHALTCAIINIHMHTRVYIRAGKEPVKGSQRAMRTLASALTCEAQQAPFVETIGFFLQIQLNRETHIHLCIFDLYIQTFTLTW